jgi:class 3 adenylate cyclase/tetratricopeptide (TPR) repeat protein
LTGRVEASPNRDVRRHLTIVFSDLSQSTRIAAAMEPEDYADLLQALRDLCERIIPRHGGEIARIDGDGVLAIFGYPIAHEDAGRRATEAALDLHDAVSALDSGYASPDVRIRLHTGIHAGTVLVRAGDLVRGRFEMLGDATNVAARVCDHAGPDEILVSEAALGADRALFAIGPRRALDLGGNRRPLSTHTVFAREPVGHRLAARIRRGVAPFSGRAAQLAQLERLLADVREGFPRVAVINGPAGIGKTRLASEFLDHAESAGIIVHRGYCEAYLGAQPLQPLFQIAQSIAGAGTVPRDLEAATVPLSPLQAFVAAHHTEPAILMIDDWQWADDASRGVIDTLVGAAAGPLLFLFSTRQEAVESMGIGAAEVVSLPPLSAAEAAIATEGLLTAPEPFLVDRILEEAGGNPLYIEELCHAQADGREATLQGDRAAGLDTMIQARYAQLSSADAGLVNQAAILGHVFPSWLFEAVTGVGATDPAVHRLTTEDFIYQGETADTLRFKHVITRDAIYRTVGLRERQALHRRAAEVLETRSAMGDGAEYLDSLAYHHGASGNADRAFHFAQGAGDAAMRVSALDRAQAHYNAAFEALSAPSAGIDFAKSNALYARYGRSCIVDPSREQLNIMHAMRARAEAEGNAKGLAIIEYWLGTVHYGLGDACASIQFLESARRTAEHLGEAGLAAHAIAGLGLSHGIACNYALAISLIDKAVKEKLPHWSRAQPSPSLAYLVATRGLLHADQGAFDEADACFARGHEFLVGVEHEITASIMGHQIAARLWQGDYAGARATALECNRVAGRVKARYLFAISEALGAYAGT